MTGMLCNSEVCLAVVVPACLYIDKQRAALASRAHTKQECSCLTQVFDNMLLYQMSAWDG